MASRQTGTAASPDRGEHYRGEHYRGEHYRGEHYRGEHYRGEHYRGEHWPTALASLAVGAAFFVLWFWLLPAWLDFRVEAAGAARWRWIAAAPSVLGFAMALRCVWDFGWTGHGTPAPVAPPTRLVVVGFYRYVRNPMYLGFCVGWVGLWVVFGRANMAVIAALCAAALGVVSFVLLYEEPHLRKIFGAEYEEYCRNVRRWVPRMRAWDNGRRN